MTKLKNPCSDVRTPESWYEGFSGQSARKCSTFEVRITANAVICVCSEANPCALSATVAVNAIFDVCHQIEKERGAVRWIGFRLREFLEPLLCWPGRALLGAGTRVVLAATRRVAEDSWRVSKPLGEQRAKSCVPQKSRNQCKRISMDSLRSEGRTGNVGLRRSAFCHAISYRCEGLQSDGVG